jgi:hypothetical protein
VGFPTSIENGDKRAMVWKAVTIPGNRSERVVGNDRQSETRLAPLPLGPTIAKITEHLESQQEPLRG